MSQGQKKFKSVSKRLFNRICPLMCCCPWGCLPSFVCCFKGSPSSSLTILFLSEIVHTPLRVLVASDGSAGVNFTNILRAAFLYKSLLHSFYLLTVSLSIFLQKNNGAKAARKMLVKLTTVVSSPFLVIFKNKKLSWYFCPTGTNWLH